MHAFTRRASFPLLAGLAACAGTPGKQLASPTVPAAFGGALSSQPAGELGQWWQRFGDPTLNRLIAKAAAENPSLLQAAARVRQARAQERIVRSSAWPSVDAIGQAGYTRISEHAIPPLPGSGGGPFGLPGSDFTTFRLGFDASWEADLFGARKAEQAGAAARTGAAIWSARDAQVMLAAEIGNAYFQYRALQQRIALAEARIASQRQSSELVAARVRNGLTATPELRAREREVAEAEAARELLAAQRDGQLHALGILVGAAPVALADELAAPAPLPAALLDIPSGLPSELLHRRPDLRAAEQQLAAAVADTKAARADLFPKINLTGVLQLVSTALATLLSPASIQADAAARVSLPLIDGGRRRATVDLRDAQAEEASEAYRARVLSALREVEDALSRIAADRRRLEQLARSEAAARDAAETMQVRYRNGLIALAEVLAANDRLLASQDMLTEARAAATQDVVALYKALGGGWTEGETGG